MSGRWSLGQNWSELTATGAQPQTEKYEEWGRHKSQNMKHNLFNDVLSWCHLCYDSLFCAAKGKPGQAKGAYFNPSSVQSATFWFRNLG